MEETKRKSKGNSTPKSPFVLRIKRPKIGTPRFHKSLSNKRAENGEDSIKFDSEADRENSLHKRKLGAQKHAKSAHADINPQKEFNVDPLQDIFAKMHEQEQSVSQFYQNKKLALNKQCNEEIENVRKKYNALLKNEKALYVQRLEDLKELRCTIQKNQVFAQLFGSDTEIGRHGNLKEVQGTSYPLQQKWLGQRRRSSRMSTRLTYQVDDLIQKLPKLGVSKVPSSSSPSSSAHIQLVHSSSPRMVPPLSTILHSPQGIPPSSPGVHLLSILPSARNSQTISQNNLTSQDGHDQLVLRPSTFCMSSTVPPSTMPTSANICCRAPAPHLRRNKKT